MVDNVMTREEIHLEVLKLAQQLVTNQYIDQRAGLHNEWVAQSDELWRTRRMKLAYPPIPPYPTSNDVCNCAIRLLNFVDGKVDLIYCTNDNEIVDTVVDSNTISPEYSTEIALPSTPEALSHEEPHEETLQEPSIQEVTEKDSEEPSSFFNRMKKAWK